MLPYEKTHYIKKNQYYFKDMDYYICETPKILLELIDERKDILKDFIRLY